MGLAIGVDIGGTKILGAIVDEQGAIVRRVQRATVAATGSEDLPMVVEELLSLSAGSVEAVGLAVAAFVEHPSGRLAFAPNLHIADPYPGKAVADRFGLPVAVENDGNAAAWAEHLFGAGRRARQMLMVTVGTGIGGGIVVDGRLYRGSRGFAGEFGHIPVSMDGPRCACGNIGCLEAWASGRALGRLARERAAGHESSQVLVQAGGDPAMITGAVVGAAADMGDPFALELLAELGTRLGVGLAGLAKAFDPETIVVGGGVSTEGERLLGPARAELNARFSGQVPPPILVTAALGNDAGVVGAAHLALVTASGEGRAP